MILDVHPRSRFWIRILIFSPSRIPDPGVKKASDAGSERESATLVVTGFCSWPFLFVISYNSQRFFVFTNASMIFKKTVRTSRQLTVWVNSWRMIQNVGLNYLHRVQCGKVVTAGPPESQQYWPFIDDPAGWDDRTWPAARPAARAVHQTRCASTAQRPGGGTGNTQVHLTTL